MSQANSGNVELSDAAPLSVGDFSISLLSMDESLYAAAAEAEAALLAPPAPDAAEAPLPAPAPPGPA